MDNLQPLLLIVGGSNTGRSPMAVALLQRLLSQHELDWRIESAGVTSHDDDYPDVEACSAMYSLNLDITNHQARALTADMVQEATLLVAIDSGIVHVLRNLYPAAQDKVTTLGELASKQRNIPDPFRMHVSTWITYAKEIESLLCDGLPRLIEYINAQTHESGDARESDQGLPDVLPDVQAPDEQNHTTPPPLPTSPTSSPEESNPQPAGPQPRDDGVSSIPLSQPIAEPSHQTPETNARIRQNHVDRCLRLLTVLRDMPEVLTWDKAREQLQRELQLISVLACDSNDLIHSYTHVMHALLRLLSTVPDQQHIQALLAYTTHMNAPISQDILTDLSSLLTQWV